MSTGRLTLSALDGIPLVQDGDDVTGLILEAANTSDEPLQNGDILVIAQKIISKAEGRAIALNTVEPSAEATELAAKTEKDPRLVELILRESSEILRYRPGLVIAVHRLGMVMANAGIDASNIEHAADGSEAVLLLPHDSDASAARIRQELQERAGLDVAVIISDSTGRAWRSGTVGIALGAAGLPSMLDLRGREDLFGRPLQTSIVGLADELSAAASLLQGQGAEGSPVVCVRGFSVEGDHNPASALVRDISEDLFR